MLSVTVYSHCILVVVGTGGSVWVVAVFVEGGTSVCVSAVFVSGSYTSTLSRCACLKSSFGDSVGIAIGFLNNSQASTMSILP